MLPEVIDPPKNSANEAFAQDFKFSVQVSQIRILNGLRISTFPKLHPWNVSEAVPPKNKKSRAMRGFQRWWAHTDSNRGPKDYESSALTN